MTKPGTYDQLHLSGVLKRARVRCGFVSEATPGPFPPDPMPCCSSQRVTCLFYLQGTDLRAGSQSNRVRCAPACFPRPEVMGPPYTSFEGDILDVFVHGRRTSSGAERLVAVSFDSSTFMVGDPQPFTSLHLYTGKVSSVRKLELDAMWLRFQMQPR